MADDRDILTHVSEWASAGHNIALAFVLKTWGSAPRPVGSLLAICDNGEFQGSVSGGCVENAVIEEAQAIMRTGVPRTLTYGVADETAWELGLPCGGTIEILALKVSDRALIQRLAQPEPAVFIANSLTGLCAIFGEDAWQGTLPQNSILVKAALPLLASGEVMITDHPGDA